jgi:hypothetical protein
MVSYRRLHYLPLVEKNKSKSGISSTSEYPKKAFTCSTIYTQSINSYIHPGLQGITASVFLGEPEFFNYERQW